MAKFMATLTHAFRGRLNAVLGSLELLSQTRLSEEQLRFAQTAIDEGRGLLQLVNDALDLARLDADDLRLEDTPLDPVAIAEGALDTVAARLHQRQISVACRIDPRTPLSLRGDGARLRQVLVNLLDNACKATERGSVVLTLRGFPAEQPGMERLIFEVADTGPGVPESLRAQLFSPLVPTNRPTDWHSTTLGIGLALCRRLVELMHGRIEYLPRPEGGSVFRFGVQLRRDVEFERFADVFAEARGRRVWLVDDDTVRRHALGTQLRDCGISLVESDSAQAALPLAETEVPCDLLLVHQDSPAALAVLKTRAAVQRAVIVPIGMPARLDLRALPGTLLWLAAPMRRRALRDALLGRTPQVTDAPEIFHAATDSKAARVLVVEDSDANRLVMSARLERLGCVVDAVETGSEALRLLSQRRYALVLADLCLPDMGGLELTRGIRQLGGEPGRVPIVAVTGGTHPRDRERCLAAGMNAYLSKPLDQRELIRVLRRFVAHTGDQDAWDPESINTMIRDLGSERVLDLLDAFERELGQRIARLAPDALLTQLGHEAHALKSTALAFGAIRLGEAARQLEVSCQQQQELDARRGAAELRLLGRRVQAAVQSWLDRQRECPP